MLEILTFNEGKEKFNFIRKNKKRINANISYMYAFFLQGETCEQLSPLMVSGLTKAEYHNIRTKLLRELKKEV